MRILADENLSQVRELFAPYGEVVAVPGRSINASMLRDVDALLVRSVTRVTAQMLAGSRCQFVGTATSGLDHIDVEGLAAKHIKLSWARGCNSKAVVDYFFSVLAALTPAAGLDWQHASVGIIGCGQIGSLLAERLLQLGMPIRIYDPLLGAAHRYSRYFTSLQEVLKQQIITLHVPLTHDGAAPTFHLLAASQLAAIPADSLLINAARGATVDNHGLLQWLQHKPAQAVVLDTWENEPGINLELLQRVRLATPHIAGYSQQGKLTGTRMVLQDFCQHFGWAPAATAPEFAHELVIDAQAACEPADQLNRLILAAYDVRKDHEAMLALAHSCSPAEAFDALRKHYPERNEFSHFRVAAAQLQTSIHPAARILGFQVSD